MLRNDTVDDRPTHVVRLTPHESPAITLQIDAETGDLLRSRGMVLHRGIGGIPVTTVYEDHREADGLRMPWRVISTNEGTGRVVMTIAEVETNVTLPEDAFEIEPPAEAGR